MSDPVDEHIVQKLIHSESGGPVRRRGGTARKRVGNGEIVQRTDPHGCHPPYDRAEFGLNTVWRCDCGKRWKLVGPARIWIRRYWPWPR